MSGLRRPLVLPRPTYYDSTHDYHSIDDSLNRVEYFSNAVLEDQYDAALRSRGRDDALLRNANATIVSAEYQPTPHRSVSRRVRASTAPPAPRPTQQVSNSSTKEGVYYRPVVSTSGLHASRPPMKKTSKQKTMTKVEVATPPKPKTDNLMSWKYRLDSRVNPGDIIYEPASYARLRKQLQDVNGKMDRERQLLDRYLDTENMSRSTLWRAEEAKKIGGSVNIPSYYACGGDPLNRPVTELRRKIRRMVAQGKRNPNYYRMGLDD